MLFQEIDSKSTIQEMTSRLKVSRFKVYSLPRIAVTTRNRPVRKVNDWAGTSGFMRGVR